MAVLRSAWTVGAAWVFRPVAPAARRTFGRLGRGRTDRRLLTVLLLSLATLWLTLHSPTIFLNNQILLGASLGVFALLQYGWLGLPVGMTAALCTVAMWGHAWGAVVLVLQLLWQQLFLSRLNGGPEQVGNGRIVLATIVFWLLVGLPLKTLLYTGLLQADLQSAVALACKEAVVGVVNASLGLVLYLVLQLRQLRRRRGELSLRGLIFTTQLLMISLPGVLIFTAMGQQITAQTVAQFRLSLEQQAQAIVFLLPPGSRKVPTDAAFRERLGTLSFDLVSADGRHLSSDPAWFARLREHFRPEPADVLGSEDLMLLVPDDCPTALQCNLQGYWSYRLVPSAGADHGWREITVVQPARQQVELLIHLMRPALQLMALLLIAAALISEALTTLLASQFARILGPLLVPAATTSCPIPFRMPRLRRTGIRELNTIVTRINEQGRTFNAISQALQQTNERLRHSEQQHRLLADNALDVITLCDPTGRPTYISPSIEKVRGWTVAEAMALPMGQHLSPEGCVFVQAALQQTQDAVSQGLPLPSFRVELQQSHKNGTWIWTDVTSNCIVDETGRYIGTLLVYRDISDRKRLEDELRLRASVDELTGLLNRRELLERLPTLLNEPERRRRGEGLALLFCDLDLFKEVNDSLGHAAGDTVLQTVAQRIRSCLRSEDLAARVGGDEIVVVLQSVAERDALMVVARKLSHAIAQPITTSDLQVCITASIGVTLARPGEGVDALMARADIAMYQAKQAGRNRVIQID